VNGGKPEALALGADGAFRKKISLKNGGNTILVEVEDSLKNAASFSMTVDRLADATPPTLTEPNVGSAIGVKGTPIHFSIRVVDGDSGIDTSKVTARIRLSEGDTGTTVQLYDDGEHGDKDPGDGLFANRWNSSDAGEGFHVVDFYAVDQAGNTGSLEGGAKIFVYDRPAIKKPYLSTATPMSKESVNVNAVITDTSGVQSADLLYSADAGRSWNRVDMSSAGTTYIGTIPPQAAGTVYYKIKALDLHGFDSETGSYAYLVRDDTGPMISIQQPSTTAAAFTSEPFVLVSGRAADIDGPGLKSVTCSSGAANIGTMEAWSFRVPLNRGVNPITVVAESLGGKLAIDSIEVTYAPKLAAPAFSPDVPHIFTDPVSVKISTSDQGAVIRYTIDNTDPTEASPGVTSPILIAETTTIKARAYMPGWTPSDTAVGTFTLKKKEKSDVPKAESPTKEKSAVKSESVSSPKEKSAERPEEVPQKKTASLEKKSEPTVSLALQVAAFRDRDFAEDLVKKLKSKGFSAYRVSDKSPGKATWHKVRIGPFENKEEVETALEGLEKYKKKAIILVDQAGALPENKETPKHLAKKDLKTKPDVPAAPVSSKASSTREKPKAAKPTDLQASAIEIKKSTVGETESVIEIPASTEKDASPASTPESKTEKLVEEKVKGTTPSAGVEKEPLSLKNETPDGESQKERLKSFLRLYSRAYESKDLDRFVALFTYDATENNRPFYEMLPKYRKNMERIESFTYEIEMTDYTVMEGTGNVTLQGKFFTRYLLHDGTRDEKSGNIAMELEADGNSFLVKRLNYGE
jgi:cell division septation protein DedD